MSEHQRLTARDVLSNTETFPNRRAASRLSRLVGLDKHIETLGRDLRLIFEPALARTWSQENYGIVIPAVELVEEAVPLIVFEGDVGTGKTALAETIGHHVATTYEHGVHMVKMSTRVRGSGYVGEMGTLLAEAFEYVDALGRRKGEPLLFIVDEADSVLTSRVSEQHHHEDKSGVNTILQHLDGLRTSSSQVAVIAITNRVGVLDAAVLRRATAVLRFDRPNCEQRRALLTTLFARALTDAEVSVLVAASERAGDGDALLSYSDLALRFAVPAIRDAAWRGERLDAKALAATMRSLAPSPSIADTPGL